MALELALQLTFTAVLTYLAVQDYKDGEVNAWLTLALWLGSFAYSFLFNITPLTLIESFIVFAFFYLLHRGGLAGLADGLIFSAIILMFPKVGLYVLASSVVASTIIMFLYKMKTDKLIPYILLCFLVAQVVV